jgi:beta-galactosidase
MNEKNHQLRAVQTRREFVQLGIGAAVAGLIGSPPAVADATLIPANVPRIEQSFDENWRFHRGDASGAEGAVFDDSGWRSLDVPHDWRIEDLPYASSDEGAPAPSLRCSIHRWIRMRHGKSDLSM